MSDSPLRPPPAIAYLPHKNHALYSDMDKAMEVVKYSLSSSGHCREEPHPMHRTTTSKYFFPILDATPADDEVLENLKVIEPRAKFKLVSHAETLCPSIRTRGTVAIIMIMEHTAFGDCKDDDEEENDEKPKPRTCLILLGVASALFLGAFLFWIFFRK